LVNAYTQDNILPSKQSKNREHIKRKHKKYMEKQSEKITPSTCIS
jgi:hypothetical protein